LSTIFKRVNAKALPYYSKKISNCYLR